MAKMPTLVVNLEWKDRVSSTPARPVAMARFKKGDAVKIDSAQGGGRGVVDAVKDTGGGVIVVDVKMPNGEIRSVFDSDVSLMSRTLSVGFKVDGDGPYTRESMLAENTGPMVDEDPEFIAWLKSAQPGQSKNVAIGGGWTKVEAVNMAVTMRWGDDVFTGDVVECPECGNPETKIIGISPKIAPHNDLSGKRCRASYKYVTEFSRGTPPRLSAPIPYSRWLSRLGWRDTAENRACFARRVAMASAGQFVDCPCGASAKLDAAGKLMYHTMPGGMTCDHVGADGSKMPVSKRQYSRPASGAVAMARFKRGDHVQIRGGSHAGELGIVIDSFTSPNAPGGDSVTVEIANGTRVTIAERDVVNSSPF